MTAYKNPWHDPIRGHDPAVYTTDAKAVPLDEFLMYQRIKGAPGRCCWDVVKDGVCIAQRAGRPKESQLEEFRGYAAHYAAHGQTR